MKRLFHILRRREYIGYMTGGACVFAAYGLSSIFGPWYALLALVLVYGGFAVARKWGT